MRRRGKRRRRKRGGREERGRFKGEEDKKRKITK